MAEEEGRGGRFVTLLGIGGGLLIAGFAGGWFLGAAGAETARNEAAVSIKAASDKAVWAEGELGKTKTELDALKKTSEIDLKLGKAVELTLRASLEAKAANFGTAGDFLNDAVGILRTVQKNVGPEGSKKIEAIIEDYQPAVGELLKRSDVAAAKIIDAATILIAERDVGVR